MANGRIIILLIQLLNIISDIGGSSGSISDIILNYVLFDSPKLNNGGLYSCLRQRFLDYDYNILRHYIILCLNMIYIYDIPTL